ncbi:polysaccharide biosynthesis tyrosine autokinase [Dyadobacter chenwenxiniae]|uniref:non-specific protein-tyrosine kinase n=1 Tax=Dyadobacter chenwenxiniae TaxID=2906456 RepID=A0A9X1TFI0_9BACT|nr:tyrosine-protein kinase [Dyadobacter chenwenxiniae]MCF0062710.1 polysaccharide biosynthesis tyrosine autokinase [Dyadobacter chenwenxiniae]UON83545.1 polysaccharide biosynthesis tyrosine autokinase [Dyadobacter chenwenxiniae]
MEDLNSNRKGFEENEPSFNLNEYIRRLIRYWYMFPIFLFLFLTAAFFYLQISQPVYSTKTSILIKEEKSLGGSQGDILTEMSSQFGGNKTVENEMEIFKSQTLIEQVVKELGLDVTYTTKDGLRTVDLYSKTPVKIKPEVITEFAYEEPMTIHMVDSAHFRFNDEEQLFTFNQRFNNSWGAFIVTKGQDSEFKDITINFTDVKNLAESILQRVSVQQPNIKSTVLEIIYEDVDVQRSKDVLNKLLDVYIQSSLNDKNSEASNTLKFIENRLGLITGELGDVEKDVESYKTNQGITDISAESQLFLENIKENDSKLNEVNTKISILESVDNYIQNAGEGAVAPATYMIDDPVLVSLLTKFNDLELQRERYARTTSPNNPLLQTINTQLAGTRQSIRENVQNLKRGMAVTKNNLEGINTRFSAGLRSIPKKEREFVGIKRQQAIKEELYLYLLQKREETALAYASTVTDSRLIDAPISTFKPIKPKKMLVWLGSGVAGLILPLLLINLLFLLNNRVQTREDIENVTHSSILGEIGQMKTAANGQPGEESIIKMTSRSAVAEQFRALRTNLQYLGDGTCRVLMFTSSIGGEGKSFISINLAASLAYSDKRVLLIGLDLRKPTLHERLLVSNKTGASNCLIGQGHYEDFIQSSGVHPKFDVLTSGPIPPNPSELLSNGRLPVMLAELREKYDYILIDSPPYGLVTDSALIAEHVDATLYLVRFNYTILDHLKRIGELQRARRFSNLAVIFNGVNYGAGYGYGYGYGGYGYGYYAEETEGRVQNMGTRLKKLVGR